MASELVPLAESALRLGVARETALRMLLKGRLKGAKIDGAWQVEESSIVQVLGATADRSRAATVRA